jgi:hypothetical protein
MTALLESSAHRETGLARCRAEPDLRLRTDNVVRMAHPTNDWQRGAHGAPYE